MYVPPVAAPLYVAVLCLFHLHISYSIKTILMSCICISTATPSRYYPLQPVITTTAWDVKLFLSLRLSSAQTSLAADALYTHRHRINRKECKNIHIRVLCSQRHSGTCILSIADIWFANIHQKCQLKMWNLDSNVFFFCNFVLAPRATSRYQMFFLSSFFWSLQRTSAANRRMVDL